MNRRDFLKSSAAVSILAAASVPKVLTASTSVKPVRMKTIPVQGMKISIQFDPEKDEWVELSRLPKLSEFS